MGASNHINCLSKLASTKEGRALITNELDIIAYQKAYAAKVDDKVRWKALEQAISWLNTSQENMLDDGFGTYRLCKGWTSSYPETSGYIIPTLLRYAKQNKNAEIEERVKHALNWLLAIQKPEGGWQSGYVDQNKSAIVFNTGQVIRGMIAGYQYFLDNRFLEAAIKAANWLIEIQEEDGSFKKHVFLNETRVYDTYVVAPLLALDELTGRTEYKQAVCKNVDWVIQSQQLKNGWFQNCDNTTHKNDKPIIHTIAYTIDGLLDVALQLNNKDYLKAAERPALKLVELFLKNGKLNGRYNKNWKGSEAFITTGGAQLAIIWYKLYKRTENEVYEQAYTQMNKLLCALQQRHVHQSPNTKGALFGSFPFWGRYEAFSCPNWATKYFADSLMNEADYEEFN